MIFFIAAFLSVAYFGCPILKNRYFKGGSTIIKNDSEQKSGSEKSAQGENQDAYQMGSETKSTSLKITITPKDCDNECDKFEKDEELEYCQEVCNIVEYEEDTSEESDDSSENCDSKEGLQKDYCLKDKAIEEEDFKICDGISDAGVKKTCKNRLTEDILDSQENSDFEL